MIYYLDQELGGSSLITTYLIRLEEISSLKVTFWHFVYVLKACGDNLGSRPENNE